MAYSPLVNPEDTKVSRAPVAPAVWVKIVGSTRTGKARPGVVMKAGSMDTSTVTTLGAGSAAWSGTPSAGAAPPATGSSTRRTVTGVVPAGPGTALESKAHPLAMVATTCPPAPRKSTPLAELRAVTPAGRTSWSR